MGEMCKAIMTELKKKSLSDCLRIPYAWHEACIWHRLPEAIAYFMSIYHLVIFSPYLVRVWGFTMSGQTASVWWLILGGALQITDFVDMLNIYHLRRGEVKDSLSRATLELMADYAGMSRRHFPRYRSFARQFPSQRPVTRSFLMFSLMYSWTNDWSNNRDDDDFRHHPVHYDITVNVTNKRHEDPF